MSQGILHMHIGYCVCMGDFIHDEILLEVPIEATNEVVLNFNENPDRFPQS